MKRRNSDRALIIFVVAVFVSVMLLATTASMCMWRDTKAGELAFNGGVCTICRSKYEFMAANRGGYIYRCPHCGHTIKTTVFYEIDGTQSLSTR